MRFTRGSSVVLSLCYLSISGCASAGGSGADVSSPTGVVVNSGYLHPRYVPFTEDELLAAFGSELPETHAQEMVANLKRAIREMEGKWTSGVTLMPGTLDALAQISPDVARRVRQLRRDQGG